jgi:hypothetical protein
MALARTFALILIALFATAMPPAGEAQTIALAPFQAVTLRNGGQVVIRHGAQQRVTLLRGRIEETHLEVSNGRLIVDHCRGHCRRQGEFLLEIVTPMLGAVAVDDGGLVRSEGGFPPQASIAVQVASGGAIDIRSLAVTELTAAVTQGGVIFARPLGRLTASVFQGGNITYWGTPALTSAISHGGVVTRGNAADVDRPLAELNPWVGAPPPVPPIPPIPTMRK